MVRKLREFPQVGELVVCTVDRVMDYGAFVKLDEYGGKEGFVHISEVASGWIKNIRDHVREGQKVVAKVIRVDERKGHIDLSIKRVHQRQRKSKMEEFKKESRAEKWLELAAQKLGKSLDQAYEEVGYDLIRKFGGLYYAFEEAAIDKEALYREGIDPKWAEVIAEIAEKVVEIPKVSISGTIEMKVLKPNGIEIIKRALKRMLSIEKPEDVIVRVIYSGAPRYMVRVISHDYKTAESVLSEMVRVAEEEIKKEGGFFSFKR